MKRLLPALALPARASTRRPRPLWSVLPVLALTACASAPPPRAPDPCPPTAQITRPLAADVAAAAFELDLAADAAAQQSAVPTRVEVRLAADEPLLAVQLPCADCAEPDEKTLRTAALGVPLDDGTVVVARGAPTVQLQIAGDDTAGRLRFVRLAPAAHALHLKGEVAATYAAPRPVCGAPDPVHVRAADR